MAPKTVTIALLGESGVGKTTLINMIGQYFANGTLEEAKQKCLQIYAPCSFSITDDNNIEHLIQVGPNDVRMPDNASTKKPQTYTFLVQSQNMILNIVDTPGLASSGGVEQDNKYLQDTLRYLGEYKQLDAICLLLKPTNPRCNVVFEHVIRHIVKYLQPAILNNIMFIFTNTRGSSFKPGNTYEALNRVLQGIVTPVVISLRKNNTYCTDNEAFRYLAALGHGVSFPDDDVDVYSNSFDRSKVAINSMLEYINNHLSPVLMHGALSINESERIVLRLSDPLLGLVISLEKAIVSIEEDEEILARGGSDVDFYKNHLFKTDYKKIVRENGEHIDNLHIKGSVEAKVTFLPFLGSVNATVRTSYNNFNRKTYSVDFVENKVIDREVLDLLKDSKDVEKVIAQNIQAKKQLRQELQAEINTATTAIATFYKFLQETNNLTDDDPFVTAIESAMSIARVDDKSVLADEIGKILQKYKIKKTGIRSVQPQEIVALMNQLVELKHCGPSFRELMNMQFEFNSIQYSIQ